MPTVRLKDYKPSDFTISHIDIKFELDEENTTVTSTLNIKKQNTASIAPLVLNGGAFELKSIQLNHQPLEPTDYTVQDQDLTLHVTSNDEFQLTIITTINPKENTALQGLYKTEGLLTSQCEAEGFRNITFYLDRPDVLATFTTEIHADKNKYPVLLSNGNLVRSAMNETDATKHYFIYHDPIPKPSYLFALVAGQLALREDFFITRSNKRVTLNIFVPAEDLHKTEHAMEALKAAMRFDEEHYDREYDLDIYNIVGVPQFNAGAMENKGLNIFDNASLLAQPKITTDDDFEWIYSTVGHEYFHNWRGNRVTVNNWFQLSLKEGFATITDQEFSQSLYHSTVPRISDVEAMQERQFAQDAGPLAHPVMPEEYDETDNLYTTTIYRKGAELLNMLKLLLGQETFRKGCSIYFDVNDGKAANIEDFVSAMQTASDRDLSQFLLWYQQAGTPQLEFEDKYDADNQTYHLSVTQRCPPTPGQPEKKPLLIPIAVGLLNAEGEDIPLQLESETVPQGATRILELYQATQTFTFVDVKVKPIPSLLRQFSAPVNIIKSPVSEQELKFLLKHDSDPINRWLASRTITKQTILKIIQEMMKGENPSIDTETIESYRAILLDSSLEPRLASELLSFPGEMSFFHLVTPADPDLIYKACEFFKNKFVQACYTELRAAYERTAGMIVSPGYTPEGASVRCLKNRCLSLLMRSNEQDITDLCIKQLETATNMTDTLGALSPLAVHHNNDRIQLRQNEIDKFIQKWQHDALVIAHVFNLYAFSKAPDALDQIMELTQRHYFKKENPGHIGALIGSFSSANPLRFHDISGKAYKFLADFIIEIDQINPSSAADLVPALGNWKQLESVRQAKMLEQLLRLHDVANLSSQAKELVDKSLQEVLSSNEENQTSLLNAIATMRDYGNRLKEKGASKGQVAIDLADELMTKANIFFKSQDQSAILPQFKTEFLALLISKNSEMSEYRVSWPTILKNVAIALTGIGLAMIAGQLLYSKLTDGRALFFFQKDKTTCEENIEKISESITLLNE